LIAASDARIRFAIVHVLFVLVPRQFVDADCCIFLQIEESFVQKLFVDVMQQRGELQLGLCPSRFTHAGQSE
jgi:hypothetical protein